MDPPHSSLTAPAKAPTTSIPRPGLRLPQSRLPSLRPTSVQLPRPVSPEVKPLPRPIRHSVSRPTQAPPPPPPPPSSHRSASSIASSRSSIIRPPSKDGSISAYSRQPLSPTSRPQSRHDSVIIGADGEQYTPAPRHKATRQTSQQENAYQLLDSPEESDASTGLSDGPITAVSPIRAARRPPRPSLSDRTVESLSSIPPSPAVRRRSSFFNPQSPMGPSRPESSMGQVSVSKLNYNPVVRDEGFVRPASPTKLPGGSGISMTPSKPALAKRSISSGMTKTPRPVSTLPSPHKRAESTTRLLERSNSVIVERKGSIPQTPTGGNRIGNMRSMPRPLSTRLPPPQPTTSLKPRPLVRAPQAVAKTSKPTPSVGISPPASPASPTSPASDDGSISPTDVPRSSASLRAQIAKAKAAYRAASVRSSNTSVSDNAFEDCVDPFNQAKKETPLQKRIDAARRDGRLNVAALGLKQIPDEVLRMYDVESMQASSMTWSETVDLVRFNAADNQIEQIGDGVFPDSSPEDLANAAEAKGNQFGGISNLDLHGNILKTIPMGIRRLERLTVLNLARNKLDNSIFDVVQHMPFLQELYLNDNELSRDVPECIGQLSKLEVLDLEGNKLTSLPGSVRNLVDLRVLNLSRNRFAELPIGSLFSLPSLREVSAASNALTGAFFPMTVDIVRSLQILDISNNSLASVSFGAELHLPAIQVLNVSRNRLFALPNVSSWTNLFTLLAEENGLTAIPEGMTTLKKLRVADFKMNSLRAIDAEVANMDALETFGVAANPLRDKKFLTMGAGEIKDEMRKRLTAAKA